jgi:putative transposase
MKKTYKFRLYPSKSQATALEQTLDTCRWVYNQTLAYRKQQWEDSKKSVSKYDTHKLLPEWKTQNEDLLSVHSQVLQNVQERVDLAFKSFFRRIRKKETPGYPRFKGRGWYDSFTYPQLGFKIESPKIVFLSKIGKVKINIHRKIEGTIKRVTILRTVRNKWYASFVVVNEEESLPRNSSKLVTGIDVGITNFLTFSDGSTVENPRFFRSEEKMLAKAQCKFSKTEKGSKDRKKTLKVVQRIHERIANKRLNFAHQLSHKLVTKFRVICVESLNIKSMLENGTRSLSKSISDASWNLLLTLTTYKAASAGSVVVFVDPKNTSQMCSQCGMMVPKDLSVRIHKCPYCNLEIDRDHNAALNILRLGTQTLNNDLTRLGLQSLPSFSANGKPMNG